MLNEGVGSWTARRARKTPGARAVLHAGRTLSYAGLHDRVGRLARALRGLGAGPGTRVAYLGPNHPSFLETMFAAWSTGAVFVPLNMRLAGPELAYQLADCGAGILVFAPEQAAVVAGIRGEAGPGLSHLVALARPGAGEHDYESLLAGPPPEPEDVPVSLGDPGLIMYTSGTTGQAKGATLTHGNITWNAINVVVDADFRADEVALVVAPLFHTAALNMLCLPTMLKGGAVLIEAAFDPARVLELIARYRVTSMFGVPAIYDAMAAAPGWAAADTSSLRMLMCGGAPVPDATIRRYTGRGLTFIQGYGMTETAPGALLLDAEHARSKAGLGRRAALLHRRPGGPPGWGPGRARRAGGDPRGRPERDARLLGPAGSDRGRAHRRLAALRRRGDHRRGRLRVRGGPHQRRDHFRRGEHLPGRGRERAAQPPGRGRLRGDRGPGRPVG